MEGSYQLILSSSGKVPNDLLSVYNSILKLLPNYNEVSLQTYKYPSLWLLVAKLHIKQPGKLIHNKQLLARISEKLHVDINLVPENLLASKPKLILFDVDSTIIKEETIDELAEFCGVKKQVADITQQAMLGEIDFGKALQLRLNLIKDLPEQRFLDLLEQLRPQDGLAELLAWTKRNQIITACVSGGFTIIVEQLRKHYGLDYCLAHDLEFKNGKFTGKLLAPIINAESKLQYLLKLCQQLTIERQQAWVVGDGSNDIKMAEQAGLAIGIKPKPALQQVTDINLYYTDLNLINKLI